MVPSAREYSGKMGARILRWLFLVVATLLFVLIPSIISAGTIKLQWDPVSDPDLAGYKVYYGTSPGVYTSNTSVAVQNSADLTNLQDCRVYYLAVKAVDANGNESLAFSNEISGMSAPIPASISPSNAKQATNGLNVTITGSNFDTQARPDFGPDIVVNNYSTSSCNQMTANISILEAAEVNTAPALPRLGAPHLLAVVGVDAGETLERHLDADAARPFLGEAVARLDGEVVLAEPRRPRETGDAARPGITR